MITEGGVEAAVLELAVHLAERARLTATVDQAVGARCLRQGVRRPELGAVGAGVETLAQPRREVHYDAVQSAAQEARCHKINYLID